jgi:hypothetical protein
VQAAFVVMAYPLCEDTLHIVCRQGNQVIQAFPPPRADEPLTQGVGSGTLGRCFEDPESKVVYVLVKLLGENAVAVMQEEAVAMVSGDGFP